MFIVNLVIFNVAGIIYELLCLGLYYPNEQIFDQVWW